MIVTDADLKVIPELNAMIRKYYQNKELPFEDNGDEDNPDEQKDERDELLQDFTDLKILSLLKPLSQHKKAS